MNKFIKRLVARFNHIHYFEEQYQVQGYPDPKVLYKCHYCSKSVVRRPTESPVNPIVPTLQQHYEREVARGNAAYVMRPNLGTEGEPKL